MTFKYGYFFTFFRDPNFEVIFFLVTLHLILNGWFFYVYKVLNLIFLEKKWCVYV